MNISGEFLSSSSNSRLDNKIKGGQLFYIGFGIGLIGGILCACIIACANYYKHKRINSNTISINTITINTNDDEIIIKELFESLGKREIFQVL